MTRRNTPEKKLARRLQAETGDPYMVCLAAAKARICAEQIASREPNNSTTPEIEAEYEALKARWQKTHGHTGNAHHVKPLEPDKTKGPSPP